MIETAHRFTRLLIGSPDKSLILDLPLALELIEPNSVYGVRTQATLAIAETWYEVNGKFGKAACIVGLLSIALNLALHAYSKMHAVVKFVLSAAFAFFAMLIAVLYSLVFT